MFIFIVVRTNIPCQWILSLSNTFWYSGLLLRSNVFCSLLLEATAHFFSSTSFSTIHLVLVLLQNLGHQEVWYRRSFYRYFVPLLLVLFIYRLNFLQTYHLISFLDWRFLSYCMFPEHVPGSCPCWWQVRHAIAHNAEVESIQSRHMAKTIDSINGLDRFVNNIHA